MGDPRFVVGQVGEQLRRRHEARQIGLAGWFFILIAVYLLTKCRQTFGEILRKPEHGVAIAASDGSRRVAPNRFRQIRLFAARCWLLRVAHGTGRQHAQPQQVGFLGRANRRRELPVDHQRRAGGKMIAVQQTHLRRVLLHELRHSQECHAHHRVQQQGQDRDGEHRATVAQLIAQLPNPDQMDVGPVHAINLKNNSSRSPSPCVSRSESNVPLVRIWPRWMMAIRSHKRSASRMMCVENTTHLP